MSNSLLNKTFLLTNLSTSETETTSYYIVKADNVLNVTTIDSMVFRTRYKYRTNFPSCKFMHKTMFAQGLDRQALHTRYIILAVLFHKAQQAL